jgi:hypothetical protein
MLKFTFESLGVDHTFGRKSMRCLPLKVGSYDNLMIYVI